MPHTTYHVVLAAPLQEHIPLATNVYQYRSTTVHVLLTDKFRVAGVLVRTNLVCVYKHLRYMMSEAGPSYTSGHSFLDAWATPYGQAVSACTPFQILTLFDHPSTFSIIVVRGVALMLVGCRNSLMIVGMVAAVEA